LFLDVVVRTNGADTLQFVRGRAVGQAIQHVGGEQSIGIHWSNPQLIKAQRVRQRRCPIETCDASGSVLNERLGKVIGAEDLILKSSRIGGPIDHLLTIGGSDTAKGRWITAQRGALKRRAET